MSKAGLRYHEDIPADIPLFDFDLVAKALSSFLLRESENAIIVGLHGPWGSGKTTLMRAVRAELDSALPASRAVFSEFTAWKYQDRQALWRALILHVLAEMRQLNIEPREIDQLEQSLYHAFEVEERGPLKINWRTLITEIVGIVLSIFKLDFVAKAMTGAPRWLWSLIGGKANDKGGLVMDDERVEKIAGILERRTVRRHVLQVQSIEQFLTQFRALVKRVTDQGKRLFVFVDDLDRCLPENALEVFEAIKLFLDAPGCAYVLALDRDVIRKGLAVRYAAPGAAAMGQSLIDADEYIEKTLSISFDVPRLSDDDVLHLIGSFDLPAICDDEHPKMIVRALGHNPRRIKRFMNTLLLQIELARLLREKRVVSPPWEDDPRRFDCFLKLSMVSYAFSDVFSRFLEDSGLIERLQRVSNKYEAEKPKDEVEARRKRRDGLQSEAARVQQLHEKEDFWRLMATKPNFLDNKSLVLNLLSWFRS